VRIVNYSRADVTASQSLAVMDGVATAIRMIAKH
jgi:hypothetical protein